MRDSRLGACPCNFTNGTTCATEWSGGSVIDLGGLPGSTTSLATGINDAEQAAGFSVVGGLFVATKWSGGSVIDLRGLPSSTGSVAYGINDTGQAVGASSVGGGDHAVEWSGGSVIDLGGLPSSTGSAAGSINDAGQVVGFSATIIVPESSTWAMMLVGLFACEIRALVRRSVDAAILAAARRSSSPATNVVGSV